MGLLFLEILFSTWKLAKKGLRHLAECKGRYKLHSFIMSLEKNKGTELTFENFAFVHTVISLRPLQSSSTALIKYFTSM